MKPARILSVIFNPLIVLSLLPFVVTLATGRLQETIVWTLLLALCMVCIAVYVWYGTKKKFFSDFDVTQKSQRGKLFVGYAVAAIFYLLMLFVFHGPVFLKAVLLATIAWLGVLYLVTKYIKASAHVALFSAFSLMIGMLYGGAFWLFLLAIPVIAWARIKTKRHTIAEVVLGFFVGVFLFGLILLTKNFV